MSELNKRDAVTVGVDGCKNGWLAVYTVGERQLSLKVFHSIPALWRRFAEGSRVLIDIPIGLPSHQSRRCDIVARQLLGPRRYSVFSPPTREALNQPDYRSACAVNRELTGKSLSKQAWNISKKIAEVDEFLRACPVALGRIREAHPELCFWSLADGKPMSFSKKTSDGRNERKLLLHRHVPNLDSLIQHAVSEHGRQIAMDDILDATVLCVVASGRAGQLTALPFDTEADLLGLPMEMVLPHPPSKPIPNLEKTP